MAAVVHQLNPGSCGWAGPGWRTSTVDEDFTHGTDRSEELRGVPIFEKLIDVVLDCADEVC
jgi:hypothetical protein